MAMMSDVGLPVGHVREQVASAIAAEARELGVTPQSVQERVGRIEGRQRTRR